MEAVGAIHAHDSGTSPDNGYNGMIRVTRPPASGQYINMTRAGNTVWSLGMVYNTNNFAIGQGAGTDSSFTSPAFTIDNTGNVGIGTTTPMATLAVAGTQGAPATSGTTPTAIARFETNSGNGEVLDIGGLSAGPVWLQVYNRTNLATNYSMIFQPNGGSVGIGTTSPVSRLDVNGGISAGSYAGINAAPTNGMIISGNVGIGTYTPAAQLQVTGVDATPSNYALQVGGSGGPSFFVRDDGSVGIGTTPTGNTLTVSGATFLNGTNSNLALYSSSGYGLVGPMSGGTSWSLGYSNGSSLSFSNTALTWTSLGNVGIGTTNPTKPLTLNYFSNAGGSGEIGLQLQNTSAFNSTQLAFNASNLWSFVADGTSATGRFYLINYTTGKSPLIMNNSGYVGMGIDPQQELHIKSNGGDTRINIQSGHEIQSAHLMLTNGWYGNQVYKTAIVGAGVGNWSQSDLHFVLNSENNNNNYVVGTDTKMIVKNNGNVGIGTTSPSIGYTSPGSVLQSAGFVSSFRTGDVGYHLYNNGAASEWLIRQPAHATSDNLFFSTQVGATVTDRMVITNSGNVGIGTTAPATLMEAVGAIHAHDSGTSPDNGYNGMIRVTRPPASGQYINMTRAGNTVWSLGMVYNTNNFAIGQGAGTDSSFTSPAFTIDNTGNVGIGTSSPAGMLHVAGATSVFGAGEASATPGAATIRGANATGSNIFGSNLTIQASNGTGTGGSGSIFFQTAPVAATGSAANTLATALSITSSGNVGIGTTSPVSPLNVNASGMGLTHTNGSLKLETYVDATSTWFGADTTALNLFSFGYGFADMTLNNGLVGIGTTSPSMALDVVSPTNTNAIVVGPSSGTSSSGDVTGIGFRLRNTSGGAMNFGAPGPDSLIGGVVQGTGNTSGLAFYTRASNVSMPERMRIDNNGNVGIGTATPTTKLTVNGGQILSTVFNAGASTSIDWNNGNVQYTSANCGAITLSNTLEGGAYTLIVTGATSGTCTFSQTVPDSTMATYKFSPVNAATTASSTSTYTMIRAGNILYISWITGF